MTKTFCDRCGKEITPKETKCNLIYNELDGALSLGIGTTCELCTDCLHEFLKWMENKK